MKKLSNRSSLVYVHGTNGSGKSTLARAILAAAGGATGVNYLMPNKKATYTHTKTAHVVLVGKYGAACGGVDGLSPYASIHGVVEQNAGVGRSVFAEGLITPGVETCKALASHFNEHLFIFLDTPVEQCIANVLKRRARKGNTKAYDPANLYKKRQSAEGWARRLTEAGLSVKTLTWDNAYTLSLERLGLEDPELTTLL